MLHRDLEDHVRELREVCKTSAAGRAASTQGDGVTPQVHMAKPHLTNTTPNVPIATPTDPVATQVEVLNTGPLDPDTSSVPIVDL